MNATVEAGGPVADLPNAAKFVHFALRVHDEPLTRAEIEAVTGLATSTVTDNLSRLTAAGCVEVSHTPDPTTPRYKAVE